MIDSRLCIRPLVAGPLFEDYSGRNWWFFIVILAEKFLVAIITPAFSAASGAAQPTLLLLLQCTYLGLLVWRQPFIRYMDNVHHIITKANHVMVYLAFFGVSVSQTNETVDYAEAVANFVMAMQMISTIHLMCVQMYDMYQQNKGNLAFVGKLLGQIVGGMMGRKAKRPEETETAEVDNGTPVVSVKSSKAQSSDIQGSAKVSASANGGPTARRPFTGIAPLKHDESQRENV
jgi:hypothetical protein